MSEMTTVPAWDVSDRMRKALRESRLSVQEMADYLDVTRNTVGNWINGRVPPSTQTLRLWALRTGVPFDWLRGENAGPSGPPSPGDGDTRKSLFENSPTVTTFTRKARKSDALVGNTPSHVRYGKTA